MWKKKRALRKRLISKVYLWTFVIASFFTGLFISWAYAYSELEYCKLKWWNAFYESKWPVWFVIRNSR